MKSIDEITYQKYLDDHYSKFIRVIGDWKVLDVCPMNFNLFLSHKKFGLFKEFYETTIRTS